MPKSNHNATIWNELIEFYNLGGTRPSKPFPDEEKIKSYIATIEAYLREEKKQLKKQQAQEFFASRTALAMYCQIYESDTHNNTCATALGDAIKAYGTTSIAALWEYYANSYREDHPITQTSEIKHILLYYIKNGDCNDKNNAIELIYDHLKALSGESDLKKFATWCKKQAGELCNHNEKEEKNESDYDLLKKNLDRLKNLLDFICLMPDKHVSFHEPLYPYNTERDHSTQKSIIRVGPQPEYSKQSELEERLRGHFHIACHRPNRKHATSRRCEAPYKPISSAKRLKTLLGQAPAPTTPKKQGSRKGKKTDQRQNRNKKLEEIKQQQVFDVRMSFLNQQIKRSNENPGNWELAGPFLKIPPHM